MFKIIGLVVLILICVIFLILIIGEFIFNKFRLMFGYKKYEYTKILSHGMKTDYKWFKCDEDALKYGKYYHFVEEIKPNKRRIKPLE